VENNRAWTKNESSTGYFGPRGLKNWYGLCCLQYWYGSFRTFRKPEGTEKCYGKYASYRTLAVFDTLFFWHCFWHPV